MCRLHFTCCIFVVAVCVCLYLGVCNTKVEDPVHGGVGCVNRETMISNGALDPGQVVWTPGLGNRRCQDSPGPDLGHSYASNFAHLLF